VIRRGQAGAGPTRGVRRAGAPAARASPAATRLRPSLKRFPRQEMPPHPVCSLRRSLHGSGRSAASRHPWLPHSICSLGATVPYHASALGPPPLTLRMSAAAVESVAERTRARSSFISPYSNLCFSAELAGTKSRITPGALPHARYASGGRLASYAEAVTALAGARSVNAAKSRAGCAGPASSLAAPAAGSPLPTR